MYTPKSDENLIRAKTQLLKSASIRKNNNYSKSAPFCLPDLVKKNEKQELIQYSLKVKQKLELLKKEKIDIDPNSLTNKSIIRPKKTIYAKTLSIDKWIEAHSNRNKKVAFNKLMTSNKKEPDIVNILNQLGENDQNMFNELIENTKINKNAISYRDLKNMTLLDKIQEQLKYEFEESTKRVYRLKAQQEFNFIVSKMRVFLEREFDESNIKHKNMKPRLYEYVMK